MSGPKHPKLVGYFIRQRRENLGLSQRALGLLFNPAVTTQFISNVERGVTPLPPAHVPTLTQALMVSETELLALLEREYTLKLSGRIGTNRGGDGARGSGHSSPGPRQLIVSDGDYEFVRALYDAYRQADDKTRVAFSTVCESMLRLPKSARASEGTRNGSGE